MLYTDFKGLQSKASILPLESQGHVEFCLVRAARFPFIDISGVVATWVVSKALGLGFSGLVFGLSGSQNAGFKSFFSFRLRALDGQFCTYPDKFVPTRVAFEPDP